MSFHVAPWIRRKPEEGLLGVLPVALDHLLQSICDVLLTSGDRSQTGSVAGDLGKSSKDLQKERHLQHPAATLGSLTFFNDVFWEEFMIVVKLPVCNNHIPCCEDKGSSANTTFLRQRCEKQSTKLGRQEENHCSLASKLRLGHPPIRQLHKTLENPKPFEKEYQIIINNPSKWNNSSCLWVKTPTETPIQPPPQKKKKKTLPTKKI